MELVPVLRLFWRRRLLLGAGLLGAVTVLVALGGTKLVTTQSARATTSVVLETPRSQLVDAAPEGADSLAWRASLLAHLMATRSTTQELARRLGVKPYEVAVVDPTLAQPLVPTDTAEAATKVSNTLAPYVLTPLASSNLVPMISIQAVAPDRAGAQRLAQAAVAVLQSQTPTGRRFSSQVKTNLGLSTLQPYVVGQVAPVRVKLVASTSLSLKAIGGSLFLFVVWTTGALLLPRLSRGRRAPGPAHAGVS